MIGEAGTLPPEAPDEDPLEPGEPPGEADEPPVEPEGCPPDDEGAPDDGAPDEPLDWLPAGAPGGGDVWGRPPALLVTTTARRNGLRETCVELRPPEERPGKSGFTDGAGGGVLAPPPLLSPEPP